MLQRLMRDHQHIAILLKILRNKYNRLVAGELVNFNLIRDILEYMQSYVEHSHHPMEDIIYEYYLTRKPDAIRWDRLAHEHRQLIDASNSLVADLNLVLNDVVVAKDKLAVKLIDYIESQERHMQFEEDEIFPELMAQMSEEDWNQVEQLSVQKLIDDPLFSGDDKQLFNELRHYIATAE
jgi:hemerythrin-like domain-containing protein